MDDELFDLLAPTVADLGLELISAQKSHGLLRVVVDRAGGADLDAIAGVTRAVSAVLDAHDPHPGGRYTLEVSSPGVERPLRNPDQFVRAVGETVTVRTISGSEGERRFKGTLASADEEGFVLESEGLAAGGRRFSYDEVERARTVFEWPAPSRSSRERRQAASRGSKGRGRTSSVGKVASS